MTELQPSESLKIIQEIIQQRKQKYGANGFFLLFWGALIALSGIVQFTMLISNFYPKQSGMVWAVLMPLGFVINFGILLRNRGEQRKAFLSADWLDWAWCVAGIVALLSFCMPFSLWNHYEIALLTIYFPFAFVALAVALHLKMRLWVATSLIAIVIIYTVLYCQYGVYLPLLSSVLACLLFLIPGVQLYIHYKKQQNV